MLDIRIPFKGDRICCTQSIEITETKTSNNTRKENKFQIWKGQVLTIVSCLYLSDKKRGVFSCLVDPADRSVTFGSQASRKTNIILPVATAIGTFKILDKNEATPKELRDDFTHRKSEEEDRWTDLL